MAKDTSKYGIVDIPKATIVCDIEKGGDKDGTARYRFSDNGKRTTRRIVALVNDDVTLPDLYGALWMRTKQGWVKIEDNVKWYDSYSQAHNAYRSYIIHSPYIFWGIITVALIGLTAYILYKRKHTTYEVQMD